MPTVVASKTVVINYSSSTAGSAVQFDKQIALNFSADAVTVKQVFYANDRDNTPFFLKSNIAQDQCLGLVIDGKEAIITKPNVTIMSPIESGNYSFGLYSVLGTNDTVTAVVTVMIVLEFVKYG